MAFVLEERVLSSQVPVRHLHLAPRYSQQHLNRASSSSSSTTTTTASSSSDPSQVDSFVVGRHAQRSDIVIHDKSVSKVHARLELLPASTELQASLGVPYFEENAAARGPASSGSRGRRGGGSSAGASNADDGLFLDNGLRQRADELAIALPPSAQLRIQDLGSTFGTRVNGTPVGADFVALRVGDVVQFGTAGLPSGPDSQVDPNQCEFVVRARPIIVCCTSLSKSLVERVSHVVRRLGGHVLDLSHPPKAQNQIVSESVHFTYLVTPAIKPTPKLLFALMCGSNIVTPAFLDACVDKGADVTAQEREAMHMPRESRFQPPLGETRRIQRIDLQADEERFVMFSGIAFVFARELEQHENTWAPLVRRGNCVLVLEAADERALVRQIDTAIASDGVRKVCVLAFSPTSPLRSGAMSQGLPDDRVESIVSVYRKANKAVDVFAADTEALTLAILHADLEILSDPEARANADQRAEKRAAQREAERSAVAARRKRVRSDPDASSMQTAPSGARDAQMVESVAPPGRRPRGAAGGKGKRDGDGDLDMGGEEKGTRRRAVKGGNGDPEESLRIDFKKIKLEVVTDSLVAIHPKPEPPSSYSSDNNNAVPNFKAFVPKSQRTAAAVQKPHPTLITSYVPHHSDRPREEAAEVKAERARRDRARSEREERKARNLPRVGRKGKQKDIAEDAFTAAVPSRGRTVKSQKFWDAIEAELEMEEQEEREAEELLAFAEEFGKAAPKRPAAKRAAAKGRAKPAAAKRPAPKKPPPAKKELPVRKRAAAFSVDLVSSDDESDDDFAILPPTKRRR